MHKEVGLLRRLGGGGGGAPAAGQAGEEQGERQEAQQSGGRVQVAGALVSLEDESVLCSFTVDLVRNNSMFGYAISGLDIL